MAIQTSYSVNPEGNYAGLIARPNEPTSLDFGRIYVPAAATGVSIPKPGMGVYYDRTRQRFALPTDVATARAVIGIIHYRRSEIGDVGTDEITFENDDEIEVGVLGTYWVNVQNATRYGDRLAMNTSTGTFHVVDSHNIAADGADPAGTSASQVGDAIQTAVNSILNGDIGGIGGSPVMSVSPNEVAANGLAMARIGFGKIW